MSKNQKANTVVVTGIVSMIAIMFSPSTPATIGVTLLACAISCATIKGIKK